MIEKIAVFANMTKPLSAEAEASVRNTAALRGVTVETVRLTSTAADLKLKAPKADLAVSIGGDGTVLTCAGILKNTGIPIMAVKLGTFGYITDISADEFSGVFEEFVKGTAPIHNRLMLRTEVLRGDRTVFNDVSLNDTVVSAVSRAKNIKLTLSINGTLASNLRGDGLIIATPTGSTAYSLSAGGPILDAGLDSMVINPICPFTMSARPLVVPASSKIRIDIPAQTAPVAVTTDGHNGFDLEPGDIVLVERNETDACFVANRKRNFIEVLRNKLNWAGSFAAGSSGEPNA